MTASLIEKPELEELAAGLAKRILIIEDEPAVAEVLALRLERLGFKASWTSSGRTGLAMAQAEHPDLVILDLHLPDADGLSICQELSDGQLTADIPVIVVSGLDEPNIVRQARSAGCKFFLRKPYDPNALLVLIQHCLDEKESWECSPEA